MLIALAIRIDVRVNVGIVRIDVRVVRVNIRVVRVNIRVVRANIGVIARIVTGTAAVFLLPGGDKRKVAAHGVSKVIGLAVERPSLEVVAVAHWNRGLGCSLARHNIFGIHRAAARGVERHPIRDAVLIGRGLARGPSAKEGLGLEGHTVRNLDRIAFVDGAFRGGFCAVGGVANRRIARGTHKLDALRTGVRAGSEARHRCRRLPVRSDMHGYLDGRRCTGRVNIRRVADPTLRSQGLSAQIGRIKTVHLLPFDVY